MHAHSIHDCPFRRLLGRDLRLLLEPHMSELKFHVDAEGNAVLLRLILGFTSLMTRSPYVCYLSWSR